ncbi:GntR family transcriptional regulator [Luteolibacter sp. GHJ8]|jgi:DNA-binding GntR family transcriptional regulator|uniref:GntR family transcriptional regulator n=1 Tax=Luteolibacter rhizosphaerae TaxID=2989719 RepID=A0ABT3G174_9BACT|nr:GntR family transcriptional regulator [Luteolibacter rhizosphaerae]MCW1913244.1 GntR family transcriptional regulator [Luteolibacter rhizosphaerae]
MASRSADDIRETIEQRIVEGEFEDGERLDEVTLAKRFGVSRTPLREALRMLAGSGLVELIPRRGAFVRHPGIVELVEMFEVMAELEALCGRLAARRISPGELAKLSVAARACEQALDKEDPDGYYHRNEEFHQLIYKAAGNSFLATEAKRLQKRLRPFRRMQLRARGRMKQSMEEHALILRSLEAGDPEAASGSLRSHVTVQGERFHDLLSSYEKAGKAAGV